MNPYLHVDQGVMIILYRKYKAFLIPAGVIFACILVILFVILPQFSSYLNNKDAVAGDLHVIDTLNNNITTLNSLQENEITQQLAIASAALPSEKDFAGILNAVSQAASTANVSVGDYAFQIGDIFSKKSAASAGQLTISITLSLTGNLDSAKSFMDALGKEFPLSEVEDITSRGDGGSQIKATFYYNPLPAVVFNPTLPVTGISPAQQKLMSSLQKDFQIPKDLPISKKSVASVSAQPQ